MRLLHTSDWHLGRSFHGVGMLEHQRAFLADLVEVVRERELDAVLVSGDVYDRALPGPEAVRVLDDALCALVETGATVILTGGNHDSARRLGFGARLLSRAGLHVVTQPSQLDAGIRVGDATVYPIPYIEPALHAADFDCEATHAGILRAAMQRIRDAHTATDGAMVVMAHTFVTGATTSESERDVSVGGLGAVPAEVFDGADYVALGHLHRPQAVRPHVRYCGSPLAYSFGEADTAKVSLVVDTSTGAVEEVPVAAPRPVVRLRGEIADLLENPEHAPHEQSWCEITLTDAEHPAAAMDRLRVRFPHALVLRFEAPPRVGAARSYAERMRQRADLDVCCDFLGHVRGRDADDQERALFEQALGESTSARAVQESEAATEQGVA